MNSKERVLAAIRRAGPDRVPVDMWALPPVTDRLRAYLGVKVDEDIWRTLGIDLRSIWPGYIGPPLQRFPDGSFIDWWGVRRKKMGAFEEAIDAPLAHAQTAADIGGYPWPDPEWFDCQGLRSRCEAWRAYALVVRDSGPHATCVLRAAMALRGMENLLLDFALNPELAHSVIARIERFYLELNRRILEAVGDLTDIYFIADDVGTQTGLLINPAMFHEYVAPSLKRFIQQGKAFGQFVMYHTDGAVRGLLPDFIEMGVDILNPIQESAKDMDLHDLKREFGRQICFHGAIDIMSVLTQGTAAGVRIEVERVRETLAPGGGFILAPTNNLMPETPTENILALYEAAGSLREIPPTTDR